VSDPAVTLDVMQALMASQATALNVSTVVRHAQLYLSSNLSRIPRLERVRIGAILAQSSPYGSQTVRSSYIDTVFRARLDPGTLADMAAAFASLGSFRTSTTLLAALDADALVSATGAHWEASGLVQNQSAVGITARVLNVLLELKPGDALVPAAARWLMLARQDGAWDCGPDTALAIQALTAYAHAAREDKASYRYSVAVNGRQTIAGAFRRGSGPHGVTTTIPIGALPVGGPSTLVISRQSSSGTMGRGPFYYVARLRYFVRANGIRPLSQGIVVTRAYQSLGGSPVTKIAAGAMVRVRLTVRTAQTLEHLRLDDPLPAGFEAVNQSLNTSQQNISGSTFVGIGTNSDLTPYLAHMDLRDDRISLFVPELPPGTYFYSYLAQATIAGTYSVGPTHAAEAFFPEVFGRSRGQIVTVS
jgi:alpha-2-macroglobulin